MKKDKKTLTLMTVAVATLLLVVIGATYAFFAAQASGGTNANINLVSGTTDSLSFSVGKDIDIKADMENFLEGMENRHGETTATATLKANNTTNQATGRYNVFFIIDHNDFVYSTEDGQAELIMKVTDPNGNEVMNITGLKRVEDGFDITTRTGGFLIIADYDIEATPAETLKAQTWKLEVTLVNLDAEQNINKGKSLNGRFYITTEKESTYELATINAIDATPTYNTIDATLNYTVGSSEIDKYYYAIEEDTSGVAYLGAGVSVARLSNSLAITDNDYIESNEATHIFNNLKPNTKYKIYSYAVDKYGINSNVYETSVTTEEYDLPEVMSIAHTETLTSITIKATAEGGSNEVSLYYFSKDNGVTWSEGQESNEYTFNDLLDTTEYKIKVKVSDAEGIYSTEYYEPVLTVAYIKPSVTTVNVDKTYNSISLTTTAAGGTNSVANYYYKVGTGEWSEAQTTNTYNITGLSENTKYTIYVKVEDINGRYSNEYSLDITTNTYEIPIVTATTSITENSIIVNATGTNGDGTIVKYMFSKDGGSNWEESVSSSYTFNNLTSGTTYQIRVKVVDNNDIESTIYSTTATTSYGAPTVNIVSTSKTSNSITVNYTGTAGNKAISYYEVSCNGGSTYNTTDSTSYTCTGLKGSTTYQIRVRAVDSEGITGNYKSTSVTTNASVTLANYIKSLYTSQGENYLYYHRNISSSANDNSYRYAGTDPKNYVCFGSDATTCPSDNLYRIIGVFGNQVKLIKNTSMGHYPWTGSVTNYSTDWANSTLNTDVLNGTYLNGLGTTWSDKIAITSWKVGSIPRYNKNTPRDYYNVEIGTSSSSATYQAKIGLIYVSDYGYTRPQNLWDEALYTDVTSTRNQSWIYENEAIWTITIAAYEEVRAFYIINGIILTDNGSIFSNKLSVRPTFYLNDSVTFMGGSGTQSDPYRIS